MAGILGRLWSAIAGGAAPAARRNAGRGARAKYDGASHGRRTASWQRNAFDPNAELHPAALIALRGVARDMVRNNAHAASAAWKLAQYLVGPGISYEVRRNGKIDIELMKLARRHFGSTKCDAEGRNNLYGLQLQAAHTMVISGEVLARRRWRRRSDGLPLPFAIQLLEPDWMNMQLSMPQQNGGMRLQGIELDAIGRRVGYWLWSRHPGSPLPLSLETTMVPAEDMLHCYRMHRPGALHGETWFAPVIQRLKDFGEFEDAQLVRQNIAACFAAFRIGDPDGDPTAAIDSNGQENEEEPNNTTLEPGIIEELPPGTSMEFAEPPGVDGYEPYSRVSLHAIAAGIGIPYEVMTGDLSSVSFISGRLGRLDFKQAVATWHTSTLIPQLCEPIGQWFIDALEMAGIDVAEVEVLWTPPRFPMMSPETEIPANRDAVRSGQATLSGLARERGEDPVLFLEEWKADAEMLDELGLTFDSDPRKVTAVGNAVQLSHDQLHGKGSK